MRLQRTPRSLLADDDVAVHLSIKIPVSTSVWLRERARHLGTNVSSIVRSAIDDERMAVEAQGGDGNAA